jgi:DNA binding domain, excisionase family
VTTSERLSVAQPGRLLLTVEEAAARLGIGRTTMFRLIKSGEVESVQIGRLRRIRPDALTAYTQRLTTAA